MPEKTALMKKYEQTHPTKHAIWRGEITKQFKNWRDQYLREKETPSKEIRFKELVSFEIVLFLSISQFNKPTFTKIMAFCSSFGMKSKDTVKVIVKKIKQGDISYTKPEDFRLEEILDALLDVEQLDLPLTLRVNEVFHNFNKLQFNRPTQIVEYFKKLQKDYPNFVNLSSSQLDREEDLITFKRLFPEKIKFQLSNRWLFSD
ncbi:MAG: hypothetical protein GF316_20475 [Candidatus Lokiarchaeota archaeon]|nr:hypothetical protein [Candidatus Lokiarchaeota archaeon]